MSSKSERIREEIMQEINDAWYGINFSDKQLIRPLDILSGHEDNPVEYHKRLVYLICNTDYIHFICKVILNIDLLPMQVMMLQQIWKYKFPMLIASRGYGKTFSLSLYSMLRGLLIPGRKVVVVGAAFRQSKFLHEYMESIWKNAPILRDMCSDSSGPRRDVDMCRFHLDDSVVTSLPIGDGSKIRGQRANDIIADEFACLRSGTIIETNRGLKKIEDVIGDDTIYLVNQDGDFEKPIKHIITPPTDIYRITTKFGYSFDCSSIHKVKTVDGWKLAKDLTQSDHLLCDNFYNFPKETVDPVIAELLGLCVSEGHVVNKNTIGITTTDEQELNSWIQKFVDYNPKVYESEAYVDKRGWNCKKKFDFRIHNTDLRTELLELGLDYCDVYNKEIPISILSSDKTTVVNFLKGLFYGDGSCFVYKDRDKKRLGVAYYSVSKSLIDQLHILLLKMGYKSLKQSRASKISERPQWMIRINGLDAIDFARLLDIEKFNKVLEDEDYFIPSEKKGYWFCKTQQRYKVRIDANGKIGSVKCFVHEEEAADYAKEVMSKTVDSLKVKSVEKLEEKESLYDFVLPDTHSFFANGFIQHNSHSREIFETVIAGFAAVSASPSDNVRAGAAEKKAKELGVDLEDFRKDLIKKDSGNQIVLSGTAYYDFNHFAEYWKRWCQIIRTKGDPHKLEAIFNGPTPEEFRWDDYAVIRIPYEKIPRGFMDDTQVARARATVHTGIFEMEYGAVFSKDSQGFFKRSLIESCVGTESEPIDLPSGLVWFDPMLRGNPNCEYVLGVDPASEVDNFSICVLERHEDHRRVAYCWTTTRKEHKERLKLGLTDEHDFYSYCAKKIRSLMKLFNVVHIAMDAQGGGIAVSEALHDPDKMSEGEQKIWPIIEEDKEKDTDLQPGLHILELCQFAKADWLGEANHGMRKDFEDRVLIFPRFDPITIEMSLAEDKIYNRLYDTLEDCVMDIEELKNELSIIEITQTASGRDKWDTPEVKIGVGKKERLRKDRYSALLMANMAARTMSRQIATHRYCDTYGGFALPSEGKNTHRVDYAGAEWFQDISDVYDQAYGS